MKIRGILFLVAGVLLLIPYGHLFNAIRSGPFGDEPGSVAFPVPGKLEAIRLSGLACLLIGVYLLVADYIKARRQKEGP